MLHHELREHISILLTVSDSPVLVLVEFGIFTRNL
jgi:hypothetical protein